MKESKTIEAVAAIIRGNQPKRKKKLRGHDIPFRNRGMIWTPDSEGTKLKR